MNTEPGVLPTQSHPNSHPDVVAGILKRIGALAFLQLLMAATLFLAAGRLNWTWAWICLGIHLVSTLIIGAITRRSSPEAVAERAESKPTEKWDKVVSDLYVLDMYIVLPLVAGLHVRFGWAQDLSIACHVAGAVVVTAGEGLSAWAMTAIAYFSTAGRIHGDRGHAVCSNGPYRFVRHPAYVGLILVALGVPVLLGSSWALTSGIAAAVLLVIGTALEDRMLQAELSGYQDYVRKVRYRLVPGIW
jgi:protein-S-isoprenylcysteine O-methyltransferase Ste14